MAWRQNGGKVGSGEVGQLFLPGERVFTRISPMDAMVRCVFPERGRGRVEGERWYCNKEEREARGTEQNKEKEQENTGTNFSALGAKGEITVCF